MGVVHGGVAVLVLVVQSRRIEGEGDSREKDDEIVQDVANLFGAHLGFMRDIALVESSDGKIAHLHMGGWYLVIV